MPKPNDRVILIKGDAGKWYDQAIFIINKNLPSDKMPKDFVREAEDIIRSYLAKKNRQTGLVSAYAAPAHSDGRRPAPRKNFDFYLNLLMLLGCIAIAAALLYGWAR